MNSLGKKKVLIHLFTDNEPKGAVVKDRVVYLNHEDGKKYINWMGRHKEVFEGKSPLAQYETTHRAHSIETLPDLYEKIIQQLKAKKEG